MTHTDQEMVAIDMPIEKKENKTLPTPPTSSIYG